MKTPCQLKELYEKGENISTYLRKERDNDINTAEMIELSYDLQTGSYISGMKDVDMAKNKQICSTAIAQTILSLCQPESVLEAGVGEATSLSGVLRKLGNVIDSYGFDLSWSRVAYARNWLRSEGLEDTTLCSGDLNHIPFLDNSIDVVYTLHAVESNGGNEESILKELYRVTRKYLILIEPGYEFADKSSRQRMDAFGYCKNLNNISKSLGFDVIENKLFPYTPNPNNPSAITIIRKNKNENLATSCESGQTKNIFACPKYKKPLKKIGDMMFSPEALVVYPIIAGIPCLRIENGIIASKYEEVVNQPNSP